MRGNPIRHLEESSEPSQFAAAIERDVVPAVGAGDHRAYRDHQDLLQAMQDFAAAAWILDCSEVLDQVLDRHDPPPPSGKQVTMRQTRSPVGPGQIPWKRLSASCGRSRC